MKNNEETFNLAKELHLAGKIEESHKLYLKLSKIYQNDDKIFFLLGTTYLQLKKYDDAINNLEFSIKLNPNFPNTYNNLGIALAEKQKYSDALTNYDKAINLKKDYAEAYLNKGISLNKLKRYDEAIKHFKFLIKINPSDPKVHNNLGNVYKNLRDYNNAIISYDRAISIYENYFEAISNKSDVLHSLKKYNEALILLNKILNINPDFDGLLEKIISNKMHILEWSDFFNLTDLIKKKLLENKLVLDPLFIHYLFDEPKLLQKNSIDFIKEEFKNTSNKNKEIKNSNLKNSKIKIGYFSGDFYNHPVLHVMKNIYKNHDKSKFEIYAFSHGPDKKDNVWREDVKQYFNEFFDINNMNDEDVIKLSEEKKINIAVNLNGLTKHDRTGVFFKRVAPIQINYLGYPGTMGMNSMDFIIADKIIIPENEKKHYIEEVLYLPKCYIPSSNDVLLTGSDKNFSRSEFNLPYNKIVFCAFHNPLKINPELFDSWINILKKVEGSVLWIKTNNQSIKHNIIKEANLRGFDSRRIVIADGIKDINDHIKRLELADIFLDSYPYNSHSTTYDYIRAKLPMVIWKGQSFASRVASSIYSSIDMHELIANNKTEYENIAIELANDKSKLNEIKNKLAKNTKKFDLFDSKDTTKNLEKIFSKKLYEKL